MINLLHGDCLELMKTIPDNSIDMVLTDPPYGTTACKWDTVIDFDLMWKELKRITKDNGAIALFGSEPFSSALRMSNIKMYKYDWKIEKPNGANFLNTKFQPSKVHEDVLIFAFMASSYSKKGSMAYFPQMTEGTPYEQTSGKQKTKNNNTSVRSEIKQVKTKNSGDRYPRSIQKVVMPKVKIHPTQKPVALLEYLVKTYTLENETVLDFTMGSGSTGVACKNLDRKFIGIEQDDKYFEIARDRIANE
jgi:site-specific DNA-methyltransferase (adenine-specific)